MTFVHAYRVQGNLSAIGQYIVITGLGLHQFKMCTDAIRNITEFFKAETVGGDFVPFKTLTKHNMECLKVSSRFLTPRINAPSVDHDQESLKIIDPHGYLSEVAGEKYVHSEDNIVQYYRMKTVMDDEATSVDFFSCRIHWVTQFLLRCLVPVLCNPSAIEPGQIVELEISFQAAPVKGGKMRVSQTLRTILKLADAINEVSQLSNA